MVKVGDAATFRDKEVKTKYPVEEGLTFGTQSQIGRQPNLIPEEGSTIREDFKEGL